MKQYTPMIQQYLTVKAQYEDAFLFFRLGDFYEMFFEDATKASQLLEITLTSRDGGQSGRIPMCGVPYHSAASYIEQLVELGYKVAICEQTEDPKQAKGVVKREVVQLITPGTVMEGKGLQEKENNYIAALIHEADDTYALAFCDVSTGESRTAKLSALDEVINEISTLRAKEIVIQEELDELVRKQLKERLQVTLSIEDTAEEQEDFQALMEEVADSALRTAVSLLFHYLHRTQKRSLTHLQPVIVYEVNQFMKIDFYSKRNLELTETIRSKGKKGSLLWLLDETMTAMGGRMLKQWIDRPLIDPGKINERLSMVEVLIGSFFERQEVRELLKEVYDLERLAGRVAFGNVNGRDLVQLKKSLQQIPVLKELLLQIQSPAVHKLSKAMNPCEELTDLLERALVEQPPISVKEGGIIREGFHPELDEYRDASRNGKNWIANLQAEERERTGIKSLKIGYNRIFGYYIEVTKANLHLLQDDRYERKQTLANCERFITPELKEKETLILQANEKSVELEYELFLEVREQVKEFIPQLQELSRLVSELDVLQCFAEVSEKRQYVKPQLTNSRELFIKDGRHPVVEKVMDSQEYVPNDCVMDEEREMLLVTGPNMSGKSTYMRQIALTAVMAQIGCFVPASEAVVPVFDQVFTRIGAADDLISGQSTFMVEMLEAKNAVTNATRQSLILFDEIGRGTSTYDGMALAQAIIEYIHEHIQAKTLFSTHYHELTVLEEELSRLKNVHVSAVEQNGRVVFLHKIKEGAADKSYGIHVAQLAELPDELIERAAALLKEFEKEEAAASPKVRVQEGEKQEQKTVVKEAAGQLSFFEEEPASVSSKPASPKEKHIIEELKSYDLLEMTPLEAMNALYALQKKLKKS
ncbi:DNA mismatch repair protein MutS [Bacillus thermotolerans]|uniref:DNA mismatch repair protein MutS n=1 Tax=Bacillus thermotolerans TaxID=1221996 RepID=A0A0F5I042_BACTR|nr:DNA mismatch repair protein MutS [Bacillus thermotolerans]KKB38896.1 DNA mismatch repair protein MutS [Bacillus thermotolerans]KKB42437.1 DNA mismatch repair protein MutS [Bacillus thermotolerans]